METYRIGEYVTVDFQFITGQPFDIRAILTADGIAGVGDSGTLTWNSAALNSATWDGLVSVEINDVPVSDYTAIDQLTGIDLATAVPEPSTIVLMMLTPLLLVRRCARCQAG
jgi:hypothetical protein